MNKTLHSMHSMHSTAALVCGFLLASVALANGGEDHSGPPTHAQSTLLPRIGVTTEEFELVAVLEPGRLLIHLDFASSNQPVPQARLEVEGAGAHTSATELAPGLFALTLSQPLVAGSHALTFTIQTPDGGDLIAATLKVPQAIAGQAHAAVPAAMATWPWLAGAAGLALAGMSWVFMRRRSAAGAASDLGSRK